MKFSGPERTYRTRFGQYRRDAENRGHSFELCYEMFLQLVTQPCHYCGKAPKMSAERKYFVSVPMAGIDRVDSSIGYVNSNVVPACIECNRAKHAMPLAAFRLWLRRATTGPVGPRLLHLTKRS